MKKYIFFLVSLCCALLPAMADQPEHPELKASDANIIGHVLDKKTGEHLSYITIALKGTTIGTVTDATGHYFLKNLPEGNFVLEASSVGYKTISRNVSLRKGKTLEENFELEEDAVALDGVVVSANRSVTKRRLAPTLVNVVDMKMFENTNSPTLSQGLNFQPGVRVETNCQNCGFQQVRINGLDTPYWKEDIRCAVAGGCDAIRIPKTERPEDVRTVEDHIEAAEKEFGIPEGRTLIMAAIESARGVMKALDICEASERLFGIALSGGDYTKDLQTHITGTGIELMGARQNMIIAARAAGVQCFDTVYTNLDDMEGFRKDVETIHLMGFDGKSIINPRQITIVHEIFTPTPKDIIFAEKVVKEIDDKKARGIGVFTVDGKMIDIAFYDGARRIIALAKASGVYKGDL